MFKPHYHRHLNCLLLVFVCIGLSLLRLSYAVHPVFATPVNQASGGTPIWLGNIDDYQGSNAFDSNSSTIYADNLSEGGYIGYDFGNGQTKVLSYYSITGGDGTFGYPTDWILQGSNDNNIWDTLDVRNGQTFASPGATNEYTFSNSTGYRYYRLTSISSTNGDDVEIAELDLGSYANDGSTWCSNSGVENTVGTDASADSWQHCWDWCNLNMSADVPLCQYNGPNQCWTKSAPNNDINTCDWQPSDPQGGYFGMPLATTPPAPPYDPDALKNIVSGGDQFGANITARGDNQPDQTPDKAFDRNIDSKWLDFSNISWLKYKFENNQRYIVKSYTITSAEDAPERDPISWEFQGSNDDSNWTTLDTRTNQSFSDRHVKNTYTFSNNINYAYYRFYNLTATSGDTIQIAEIELLADVYNGSIWCSNAGEIYATVDHDVYNWSQCRDWCETTMSANSSVTDQMACQYNQDIRNCWVVYGPGSDVNNQNYGNLDNCAWKPSGPNGIPYGMSVPATPPGYETNYFSYCPSSSNYQVQYNVSDWNTCQSYCNDTWTNNLASRNAPLCQYNADGTCLINYVPDAIPNSSYYGNVYNCLWLNDGVIRGSYFSSPAPTETPTPTPSPTPEPDNTPPSIKLTDPNTSYTTTKSNFNLKGVAEDTNGSVANVEYSIDDNTWSACTSDNGSFGLPQENFSCIVPLLDGQSYTVKLRATDNATPENITNVLDYPSVVVSRDSHPTDNLIGDYDLANLNLEDDLTQHLPRVSSANVSLTDHNSSQDAYAFSGTDSYADINDPNGELDFSGSSKSFKIDFWVNPDNSNLGAQRILLAKTNSTSDGENWEIGLNSSLDVYTGIWVGQPGNTKYHSIGGNSSTQLNQNAWNHIVASWNSDDQMFQLQINENPPVLYGYPVNDELYTSNNKLVLGADYTHGQNFIGSIDDLKIYNFAYTAAPVIDISTLDNPDRVSNPNQVFHAVITSQNKIASAEYLFYTSATGQNLDSQNWQPIVLPDDGSWDSSSEAVSITSPNLSDGRWYLYLRATDEFGAKSLYNNNTNAIGWFTVYDYSTSSVMPHYRFTVEAQDTTPPDIYAHSIIPNPTTDKEPSVKGFVKDYKYIGQGDKSSNIASISYRLNGGQWIPVTAGDGAFDSSLEEFNFDMGALTPGDYTLEIKAADASGNDTSTVTPGDPHSDYTESFTIVNPSSIPNYELISKVEDFTTHTNQDTIFTDAIWGNGYARLKQTLSFNSTQKVAPNISDFGSKFGGANVNLYKSVDGNLWLSTNQNNFIYYNTSTDTTTRYANPKGDLGIDNIFEIQRNNHRYLFIENNFNSTSIIDINNTPEDTSDDTSLDLGNFSQYTDHGYQRITIFGIDDTQSTLALYGITDNNGSTQNYIVRIDTNDTLMNPTDDTFIDWGRTDGLNLLDGSNNPTTSDFTGQYYDKDRGLLILGSYSRGLYVCRGALTPTNKSDDSCYLSNNSSDAKGVFPIVVDPNGQIWFGNRTINRLDLHSLNNTSDDTLTVVLTRDDINLEEPAKMEWVSGNYPVGDELWFVTRQGHIRAFEYNYTYDDTLDDTNYDYRMSFINARMGGAVGWVMADRNTVWMAGQGTGLYKVDITRDYASTNKVEFLPVPPQGMLEVNHIRLDQVEGTVSTGSSHSLSDLVTYEVSNNDGETWLPITIGHVVNFPTSGYKLKFRMVFTKGSTPVVTKVNLNYYAFTDTDTKDNFVYPDGGGGSSSSGDSSGTNDPSVCTSTLPGKKAPEIFQVVAESRDTLRFYFTDGDKPINHYALRYGSQQNKFDFGSLNIADYDSRSFTVSHLKAGTTYYFQIAGVNGCAIGQWSESIKTKIPLFSPLGWLKFEYPQTIENKVKWTNPAEARYTPVPTDELQLRSPLLDKLFTSLKPYYLLIGLISILLNFIAVIFGAQISLVNIPGFIGTFLFPFVTKKKYRTVKNNRLSRNYLPFVTISTQYRSTVSDILGRFNLNLTPPYKVTYSRSGYSKLIDHIDSESPKYTRLILLDLKNSLSILEKSRLIALSGRLLPLLIADIISILGLVRTPSLPLLFLLLISVLLTFSQYLYPLIEEPK